MKSKLLLFIILIAALLRFNKLGSYPVSLSWDEVAIGYNAFSISQTGRDEYGNKWPILFQSFNDYKLPGYIYLDSLFVKIFGLSEFSVRLPSALFGVFAVVIIFLLTKKLFEDYKLKFSIFNFQFSVDHICALMLAISPWHLQFSRSAFEANIALTIVLTGITTLLYSLRNKWLAIFSIPVLFCSLYFYYSPRVFVPAILFVFFLIYGKDIKNNLKYFLFGVIISVFLFIPIAKAIFSNEGAKRVREVSIFTDSSLVSSYVNARERYHLPFEPLVLNRRIPIAFETLHNYFSHLSPGFLFFGDDPNPRHRSSFHGNFYIFEITSILFGFWYLIKYKGKKARYFLIAWILLAPLPAAFAKETPHALRSLTLLPPLIIISSLGISSLIQKLPGLKIPLLIILLISVINYLVTYYFIYPVKDSLSWAYGYKQMFTKVESLQNRFDRVIVTGYYWKPYIFYLFYNKINPIFYQTSSTQESVGKFKFGTTTWDSGGKDLEEKDIEILEGKKTLLVLSPNELESIEHKKRFKTISIIKDFSEKSDLFLIGEWQ